MSEYGSDASITGSLIVDGESDIGSGDSVEDCSKWRMENN